MTLGTVLDALGRAGDAGDGGLAAELGVRGDPLLRARARRRLHRVVSVARARTAVADEVHVVRVAYLIAAGAAPEAADDPAAVAEAYARARRDAPRRPRLWWLTASLVVVAVGAFGLARGWWPPRRASRTSAASSARVSDRGATAAAAFRPLASALTDYLVVLDAWARARRAGDSTGTARAEQLLPGARAAAMRTAAGLGGATGRFDELLTAARDAAAAAPWAMDDAATKLYAAVAAVDDEAPAYGVYFDGDVIGGRSGHQVMVWTYAVEHVARYAAGATEIRAIRVRRLDSLNGVPDLAGLTRPHLREAIVLLDELERLTTNGLLPALADGAPLPMVEQAAGGRFAERPAVEARAGEIVRAELGAALGADRGVAAKLGATLARRREVFERLRAALAPRGIALALPSGLRLPEQARAELEAILPPADVIEIDAIEAELGGDATAKGFAAAVAAMVETVERHEVQHRLDHEAGGLRSVAELAHLGGDDRARSELSAYLAEMHRDPRTPKLGLTLIARFVFDSQRWGASESFAAVVLLEGLGRELGAGASHLVAKAGEIDRAAAARLYLVLTDAPPERLRDAAGRLWAKLFGAPLAELTRSEP